MDKSIKNFWENEFGHCEIAYDFAGREIRKASYGQNGSKYGWNIDHILPKSQGGTGELNNLQITHIQTNAERENKLAFWIDGTLYQVKKVSRLYEEDVLANYPYEERDKKYCIIIAEEVSEEPEYSNNNYWDDDDDNYWDDD
jgi:hypothetical protein